MRKIGPRVLIGRRLGETLDELEQSREALTRIKAVALRQGRTISDRARKLSRAGVPLAENVTDPAEAREGTTAADRIAEVLASQEQALRTLIIEAEKQEKALRRLIRKQKSMIETRQIATAQQSEATDAAASPSPDIVLIASGGSSGSHLLAQLLAAYEPFVAGPEANLAIRPDLFDPSTFRAALFEGLVSKEPFIKPERRDDGRQFNLVPNQMLTNEEAYLCDQFATKLALLQQMSEWSDVIEHIRSKLILAGRMPPNGVLIEHSPSTAASLAAALKRYPGLRAIHLVRDPRDAASSMMARRRLAQNFADLTETENLRLTVKQWCLLTALALRAEALDGYRRIRYEDLVREPEPVLQQIRAHLGEPNRKRWPTPVLLERMEKRAGWTWSPEDPVSAQSIGRYKRDFTAETVRSLEAMTFEFPEIETQVSMCDMIERFGEPV